MKVSLKDKLDMERQRLKDCFNDAKVSEEVIKTLLSHYDYESNSPIRIQVQDASLRKKVKPFRVEQCWEKYTSTHNNLIVSSLLCYFIYKTLNEVVLIIVQCLFDNVL